MNKNKWGGEPRCGADTWFILVWKKKEPSSSIVVVSTLHLNTCSPAHRPFYFLCSLPACHWHLIVKWAKWIYQRLSLHKAFGLKRGLSLSREESNQSLCLLLSGWAIACVRTLPDPKKKALWGYSLRPLHAGAQLEIRLPVVKTKQWTPLQILACFM